ncbi:MULTISPECIES: PAS domain-containing protein [unclassified Lentimonas]|uniref:PAS domain-containing protein n=2 Tax=Lentimonas TaxID=417293 RepID=UPI001320E4D6|nr:MULTISPECIES: PAS domain-containing protein [unclassified Lentimonas]CAA6695118.1 Unannotated [Lentimonas sp. CC19]CAA6697229.1 Unannotated [Lentimonas sp. CC10]CAA7070465.1 Unannotated [Lentimonas sp. CC11]
MLTRLHSMMPADFQSDTSSVSSSSPSYYYLVGVVVAIFTFAALCLVFSRIGVPPMETIIFASLSALAVGGFICRERALVLELAQEERKHAARLGLEIDRIDELYANSVACLVTFDAGTLIIDRVSAGFFDLLGISAKQDLVGAPLEEVLGVDSTHLTSVVYQIKVGTISVREELICKRADGKPAVLLITGRYMAHLHLVEATFYRLPRQAAELGEYERVMDDLERFKKGIVRREGRVLELKGEVNQLLKEAGKPVRYRVDSTTDDSRFVQQLIKTNKAVEHE